jgi:hypothetical protein
VFSKITPELSINQQLANQPNFTKKNCSLLVIKPSLAAKNIYMQYLGALANNVQLTNEFQKMFSSLLVTCLLPSI